MILLDGSEYFSSERIHCPGCLRQESKNGKIRYHHQILQAVLVYPDQKVVIPLAPEPIRNEDGREKQDCQINAGKRILQDIRRTHPKLRIIIGGDSLYSKQPFINELKKDRMSYVLVAKPKDHKVMFEWVGELRGMEEVERLKRRDQKGVTHL